MFQKLKEYCWFKLMVCLVVAAFIAAVPGQGAGYAQVAALMPLPGEMISRSEGFQPAHMVGLRMDFKDPFNFFFVMHKGQEPMSPDIKKEEYNRLIKYFLASLTTPNTDMWVNLSPYESERIMPDNFAGTGMGKDLLAQDYLLKQLTSSLMYPEGESGKEFWARVYARAAQELGTTDIPLDTFNKVWITPDKAEIYQKGDTVLLVDSHLKVMLDQDFFAEEGGRQPGFLSGASGEAEDRDGSRRLSTDVLRDIIIPIIEQEVNEGKNFALLRQIYDSMILAVWFKRALKESLLGQVYADKSKVAGIEVDDPKAREKIYQQYLEAYKTGVYNYIKEDFDAATRQMVPRRYFSGGIVMNPEVLSAVGAVEAARVVGEQTGSYDAASVTLLQTLRAGVMAFVLGLGALSPAFAGAAPANEYLDTMEAKAFAYLDSHPARKVQLRKLWQDVPAEGALVVGRSVASGGAQASSASVAPKVYSRKSAVSQATIRYGEASVPVFSGSFSQAFRQGAQAGTVLNEVRLFGWKGKVYAVRYASGQKAETHIPQTSSFAGAGPVAPTKQSIESVQRIEELARQVEDVSGRYIQGQNNGASAAALVQLKGQTEQLRAQLLAARQVAIAVPRLWQPMENFRVGTQKALLQATQNIQGVDVSGIKAQIRQTLDNVAEWQDKNETNRRVSSESWRLANFYSGQLNSLLLDWEALAVPSAEQKPAGDSPAEPAKPSVSVGETKTVWPLWAAAAGLFVWLFASIWKRKSRESDEERLQERIPPVVPSVAEGPVSVEAPALEPVLTQPDEPQVEQEAAVEQLPDRDPESDFIFARAALQRTLERYQYAVNAVAEDQRPALQATRDQLQVWLKDMERVSLPPALSVEEDQRVNEYMQLILKIAGQREEVVARIDALKADGTLSLVESKRQEEELMRQLAPLDNQYDEQAVLLAAIYLQYFHEEQEPAVAGVAAVDQAQEPVGGISLDEKYLKIDIRVDGAGMPLPANMQDPAMVNIQGLTPIIFRIEPVNVGNVPVLVELSGLSAPH